MKIGTLSGALVIVFIVLSKSSVSLLPINPKLVQFVYINPLNMHGKR